MDKKLILKLDLSNINVETKLNKFKKNTFGEAKFIKELW